MSTEPTVLQKLLTPVLNWVVETVFPNGAFYGKSYFDGLHGDVDTDLKWGSTEGLCAAVIIRMAQEQNANCATFTMSDLTHNGVPSGSWRVLVQRTSDRKTPLDEVARAEAHFQAAWGDLPSIAPHVADAPGLTTGKVLGVLETASTQIDGLRVALRAADKDRRFADLYEDEK